MYKITRKERGKTQSLFLIETVLSEDNYLKTYNVMGSTGNVYNVKMTHTPTCTCPDYQTRHRRCKHIFFVLTRIMKVPAAKEDQDTFTKRELTMMFKQIPTITNNLLVGDHYKKNYESYKKSGGKKTNSKVERKPTDDICPICLDDLENGETLDFCKYSCGKCIHDKCFQMWAKSKSSKCVFCREDWIKQQIDSSSEDMYMNLK